MQHVGELLPYLAVLTLMLAGASWIVGWTRGRDVLLRATVALVVLAVFVPCAASVIAATFKKLLAPGTKVPSGIAVPVLLGHGALAVFLVRYRLRGRDRARDEAAEIARVRGRERPRLPPEPPEGMTRGEV